MVSLKCEARFRPERLFLRASVISVVKQPFFAWLAVDCVSCVKRGAVGGRRGASH